MGVLAIVAAYLAGLNLAWQPAQIRVWNYFSWTDLSVMIVLIAPFLATRWMRPPIRKATRFAWWLAVVMAADVLFFAVGTFATGSGHPSLESLLLYWSSLLKIALVPAALVALCVAFTKGERAIVIVAGVVCLLCETVYMVPGPEHPVRRVLVQQSE